MTRYLVVVCLLAGVAIWWSVRAQRTTSPAAPAVTHARSPIVHAAAPATPALPEAHRTTVVRAKLDGFAESLTTTYPRAEAELLEIDCATPPCVIGVRFSTKALSRSEVRAVFSGVRTEIERRTGIMMTVVHSDEDTQGRDYLWMYALPAELANEHREALRASAEARYAARMAPLRPPLEQPVPGAGEPGFRGP